MSQEQRNPTPVRRKQTRSGKLTKEQSQEKIQKISMELYSHLGQNAILFVKDGREMVPYFVELIRNHNSIIARYKCYSPEGKFRCYLNHFPNCVSLMTGEQKIVYLDNI